MANGRRFRTFGGNSVAAPNTPGRMRGLGAFSVDDPSVYPGGQLPTNGPYSETGVFNGQGTRGAPLTPIVQAAQADGSYIAQQVGYFSLPIVSGNLINPAVPLTILNINAKRCYFFIQNLGPGTLFVSFGQDATPTNSIALSSQQFLEYLGGPPNSGNFVPQDAVSVATDTANTSYVFGEGGIKQL